jgi:hypothetical protein
LLLLDGFSKKTTTTVEELKHTQKMLVPKEEIAKLRNQNQLI